jgi:pimeloyl-ACP methyl ester carboxylesterase
MTIVLVHGNPQTAAVWDPLRAELGRDDVVALSPPGFGAPVPEGWGATSDDYLGWLITEVEALDGPIDLIGQDWGGGHVQRLAAARPDLIRSWVSDLAGVFDPEYVWHDTAQAWQKSGKGEALFARLQAMSPTELAAGLVAVGMPEDAARSGAQLWQTPETARCVLALYRSAAQPKMGEWSEELARAERRRALVIIATEDTLVGGEVLARRSAERFGADVAQLEGLGHFWMLQDPGRGAAALSKFFASLDAA